jgi:hypothetical protein
VVLGDNHRPLRPRQPAQALADATFSVDEALDPALAVDVGDLARIRRTPL